MNMKGYPVNIDISRSL